ncbi:MAG: polysaccharide deacetylase family protein [Magnetospirillum sp.]|nr:polysaccharide deacetylase family protein [Magnetospirillum sp.]
MAAMRTVLAAVLGLAFWALPVSAQVVTKLPTSDKVVALTFDACEAPNKAAYFDHTILDYLEKEGLPFTMFPTGLFARRNAQELARVSRSPLVEVENHSFSHPMHMERLPPDRVASEIAATDRLIQSITGRKPIFFRFPAGNYDAATLAEVEASGHRVVHWTFASGDPIRGLSPQHLEEWVLSKVRPGDILIFHINGRAPATGTALPVIVARLKARGYRFVRLDEMLK